LQGTKAEPLKMMLEEQEDLQKMLEELKTEHRDLDIVLQQLADSTPVDFLRLNRMKKRKLFLKDSISKIESMLLPDIIA
jgi:hypothetical protein